MENRKDITDKDMQKLTKTVSKAIEKFRNNLDFDYRMCLAQEAFSSVFKERMNSFAEVSHG